ncbi:MAG: twin-arginine translocase TatA/TatE family subunit [Spirochaetes bacterium]|nr:twin-arginine translocase TatA/TatE family subunit [Spirochaetota bacterium]
MPDIARGIGKGIREFRRALEGRDAEEGPLGAPLRRARVPGLLLLPLPRDHRGARVPVQAHAVLPLRFRTVFQQAARFNLVGRLRLGPLSRRPDRPVCSPRPAPWGEASLPRGHSCLHPARDRGGVAPVHILAHDPVAVPRCLRLALHRNTSVHLDVHHLLPHARGLGHGDRADPRCDVPAAEAGGHPARRGEQGAQVPHPHLPLHRGGDHASGSGLHDHRVHPAVAGVRAVPAGVSPDAAPGAAGLWRSS